jgi:hypothetical protein
MRKPRQPVVSPETRLGLLAMQFRSTRKESERNEVARQYERVVDELIESGQWEEMPSFEDMLPNERMPRSFFLYWSIPGPNASNGVNRKH